MRYYSYITTIWSVLMLLSTTAAAQSPVDGGNPADTLSASGRPGSLDVRWSGMERALQLAEQNGKTILIYVFDNTCPWCRRMREEVFPHPEVDALIGTYFIPVRIDVNSVQTLRYLGVSYTQSGFAEALGNEEVPATYFMNSAGEVTGSQPGFIEPALFATLLDYIGSGAVETESFDQFRSRQ